MFLKMTKIESSKTYRPTIETGTRLTAKQGRKENTLPQGEYYREYPYQKHNTNIISN